jgi:hypothetical protein
MRFRPGVLEPGDLTIPALVVLLSKNTSNPGRYPHHIELDHCSFSWSEDTALNLWNGQWDDKRDPDNLTKPKIHHVRVSDCIIAEPMGSSRLHSTGFLIGAGATEVVIERTLFIHSQSRNPKVMGGRVTVVNCIMDDVVANCSCGSEVVANCSCGSEPDEIGVNLLELNYIGNQAKRTGQRLILLNPRREEDLENQREDRIYIAESTGNYVNASNIDNWLEVGWSWNQSYGSADQRFQADEPFEMEQPFTILSREDALQSIAAYAGCNLPARDAVDERVIEDLLNGTGQRIHGPDEITYPPLDDIGTLPPPPPPEPPPEPPKPPFEMPENGIVTIELNGTVYRGAVTRQD